MRLINATEITVFEQLNKIVKQGQVCGCERCRLDIAAIALNNLTPNYVVSTEGEVVKAISPQLKADVQRQLAKAVAMVSDKPHHSRQAD